MMSINQLFIRCILLFSAFIISVHAQAQTSKAPFKMGIYRQNSGPDALNRIFFSDKKSLFQFGIEAGSLSFFQEGTWALKEDMIVVTIKNTQTNYPELKKSAPTTYRFKRSDSPDCLIRLNNEGPFDEPAPSEYCNYSD